MAYSQEALTSLLKRKRQYEALGGKLSTHETEGIVKGVLSTEAAKDIEASRLAKEEALRKKQLEMQQQGIDIQAGEAKSMAEYRAGQTEYNKSVLEMNEEALEDQERAGYLRTGMDVLGTETGKKAVGQVGDWLGIGGTSSPAIVGQGASVPASTYSLGAYEGSALAGMGGGAAGGGAGAGTGAALTASGQLSAPAVTSYGLGVYEGSSLAGMSAGGVGGAAPAVGTEGILGAIPSATAPAVGGTAAAPGILGTVGQVALPAAIGSMAGSWLGSQKSFQEITPWGGKKTEKMMGGVMGGAAAGFAVGGPVGGIIGGIIGFFGGLSVICTELHRQGYITSKELKLCSIYRARNIDHETFTGYMRWAPFVVNAMKKSRFISWLLIPLFLKWAKEIMHRVKPEKYNSSIVGKILLNSSIRISKFLGRKRRESWAVGVEL